MIHERSGSASKYYSVDLDYQRLPNGTVRGFLGTVPLATTVAHNVPAAEPAVGWYWTQENPNERRVWFLRRDHAEMFLTYLQA